MRPTLNPLFLSLFVFLLFGQVAIADSNNFNIEQIESLQEQLQTVNDRLHQSIKKTTLLETLLNSDNVLFDSIARQYLPYDKQVMRQLIILNYFEKNIPFNMNNVEALVQKQSQTTKSNKSKIDKILNLERENQLLLRHSGQKIQKEVSYYLDETARGTSKNGPNKWTRQDFEDHINESGSLVNMEYNECVPKKYSGRCSKYVRVWFNKSDGRHSLCRKPELRSKQPPNTKCVIECLCYEYFKSQGGPPEFYP